MKHTLALALLLLPLSAAAQETLFRFPTSNADKPHFYVTAYRDQSGSGNGLKDWGCGTDTYDGHRGSDFGVGSFSGMDAGRDIVAAADGIVTFMTDGAFDRCTTGDCPGGGGFGNYVRIEHADGTVTYYGHMKKFSILVAVGDEVTCGQKLGEAGSSGSSTGPHLHFEPRDSNVSHDPFKGQCSNRPQSDWVSQGAYGDLPANTCQPPPIPPAPLISLQSEIDSSDPERFPQDNSAGIFDTMLGEQTTLLFDVSNLPDAGSSSPDIQVGVSIDPSYLRVLHWEIFDNTHPDSCGSEFCPNDANDNPENPSHELPGELFDLHMNAFAIGETKRLALKVETIAAAQGQSQATARFWVKNIDGFYAKETFDATPTNTDNLQTFNGGDLRQELILDTWDPNKPLPSDTFTGGVAVGCTVSTSSQTSTWHWLLLSTLFFLRRRRS